MNYCYNSYCADMYAHQQGREADYDEAFEKWSKTKFEDMDNLDSFLKEKHFSILWGEFGGKSPWMDEEEFWETMDENPIFKKMVFDYIRKNVKMVEEYDAFLQEKFDEHLQKYSDWD